MTQRRDSSCRRSVDSTENSRNSSRRERPAPTYNILHILHILHTFKYGQISFTIIRKNLGVSNIELSGMNVTMFILYTFSLKNWTTGKGAL